MQYQPWTADGKQLHNILRTTSTDIGTSANKQKLVLYCTVDDSYLYDFNHCHFVVPSQESCRSQHILTPRLFYISFCIYSTPGSSWKPWPNQWPSTCKRTTASRLEENRFSFPFTQIQVWAVCDVACFPHLHVWQQHLLLVPPFERHMSRPGIQ